MERKVRKSFEELNVDENKYSRTKTHCEKRGQIEGQRRSYEVGSEVDSRKGIEEAEYSEEVHLGIVDHSRNDDHCFGNKDRQEETCHK